ncbi:hypothetical protein DPMN_014957 [Dreissena polymorpha]|uniref:Uncharacterized protein n=1 Tax=Dreissena polymorpha TaxID=45954 RepID=A0A9D4N6Y2_DREPO|nr:hypothetical protein DPMN_014957 [Dreissena polymorpha]
MSAGGRPGGRAGGRMGGRAGGRACGRSGGWSSGRAEQASQIVRTPRLVKDWVTRAGMTHQYRQLVVGHFCLF